MLSEEPLYRLPNGEQTCWISPENPTGARGCGGQTNMGAKGTAYIQLKGNSQAVLCDVDGPGVIQQIWMTTSSLLGEQGLDGHPRAYMLRAIKIEMFWDGNDKPAVTCPLGDFFGLGGGEKAIAFENDLFSSPEGRSFNCYIPMPFRTRARIVLTNESDSPTNVFYTICMTKRPVNSAMGYFHSYWRREPETRLGNDFLILPKVQGRGRFIGANFCVITNPAYCKTWWGEGEVKIYLDGDQNYPSLCGTGTEDYVGTGWGQRIFQNRYQGNLMISDVRGRENSNIYSFYRYHVPDPVYFYQDIKVAIQVMGSASGKRVLEFIDEGVSLIPVSAVIDQFGNHFKFEKLLDSGESLSPEAHDEAGVCFYRSDDWAVNAYFYFDKPASDLPGIASVDERTYMIRREKTEEGG